MVSFLFLLHGNLSELDLLLDPAEMSLRNERVAQELAAVAQNPCWKDSCPGEQSRHFQAQECLFMTSQSAHEGARY